MSGPQHWIIGGGRMGGKAKAQNDGIARLLRAGWTEVTADPEYGGPRKGVRMLVAPETVQLCGQTCPGLFGITLGPCIRGAGRPDGVAHGDSSGAQWWPRCSGN